MLHVGTVGIELRALLRQQRSAVQLTDEFDIIKMEVLNHLFKIQPVSV